MTRLRRAGVAVALALVAAPAWADHGVGMGSDRMSPIVTALLWAGGALVVGLAVIAIVSVLSRRR